MTSITWTNASGSFSAMQTTAHNEYTYAIDAAGAIHSYNPTTSSWLLVSGPNSNPIVSISVGSDGAIGVINDLGDSYIKSGPWTNLYMSGVSIGVADANNVVVADHMGSVVESSYGSASFYYGPTQVSSTLSMGVVMGVNGTTGTLYEKLGTTYTAVSGKTWKQIDVSPSSSSSSGFRVCGVDSAGAAWALSGGVWAAIPKPPTLLAGDKFVSVEIGLNEIWATFSNGEIHHAPF